MNCTPPPAFSGFRFRSLISLLFLSLSFALPAGAQATDPVISIYTGRGESGTVDRCSPDDRSGERVMTIKLTASKRFNGTVRMEASARSRTSQKLDGQHQISVFGKDLIARGGGGGQFFTIKMTGTTKRFNFTASNPVKRSRPPVGVFAVTVLPPMGGDFWTTHGGQTSGIYNHGVGYTYGSPRTTTFVFDPKYC